MFFSWDREKALFEEWVLEPSKIMGARALLKMGARALLKMGARALLKMGARALLKNGCSSPLKCRGATQLEQIDNYFSADFLTVIVCLMIIYLFENV